MRFLEFERLKSSNDSTFAKAMELYKISFPAHEQRGDLSQKMILGCSEYHFDLLFEEDSFVGMILYWETSHFIYVEHFCIEPMMRNKRYGQRALEALAKKNKPILLEIDPIVDEISKKRKAFYERAGFWENPYPHIHPPYHPENQGHLLTVMSFPHRLDEAEYTSFKRYLNETVMGSMTA